MTPKNELKKKRCVKGGNHNSIEKEGILKSSRKLCVNKKNQIH